MTKFSKHLIIIAILMGSSVHAFCDLPDVATSNKMNENSKKAISLLHSVINKYQGLSTYQDSGTSSIDYGSGLTINFRTAYKRPDMVKFEWKGEPYKDFYGIMWTLKDKRIGYTGYIDGVKSKLRAAILSNAVNAGYSLTILNMIADNEYIKRYEDNVLDYEEVSKNNVDYYIIKISDKYGKTQISYLIEKGSLLIREITSFGSRPGTVYYNSVKTNTLPDDSAFDYTPSIFSIWTIRYKHIYFFLIMTAMAASLAIFSSVIILLWNRKKHRTSPALESLYSSYKRFLLVSAKIILVIFLVITGLAILHAMTGSGDMAGLAIVILPFVAVIIAELYCLLVCFLLFRYLTHKALNRYKYSSVSIN